MKKGKQKKKKGKKKRPNINNYKLSSKDQDYYAM